MISEILAFMPIIASIVTAIIARIWFKSKYETEILRLKAEAEKIQAESHDTLANASDKTVLTLLKSMEHLEKELCRTRDKVASLELELEKQKQDNKKLLDTVSQLKTLLQRQDHYIPMYTQDYVNKHGFFTEPDETTESD